MSDIFSAQSDWENNAILHHHTSNSPLNDYAFGYAQTILILFDRIFERQDPIDYFVYPLLFLCRHYLEIQLKYILFLNQVKFDTGKNGHTLNKLWEKVSLEIRNRWPDCDVPEEYTIISDLINDFEKHDPGSTTFRYGMDKEGKPLLKETHNISISALYDNMLKTIDFLQCVSSGMEESLFNEREWLSEISR